MNNAALTDPLQPSALRTRHPVLAILGNLFRAMTGAYAISVILFLLMRWLIGEQWTLVALLNSFYHLVLVPSLILIPLCLVFRYWRLALALVPAAAFFLLNYAVFFLPRPVNAAPDLPHLSLLTYNLRKDNLNTDAVMDIIRQADADVVALQELTPPVAERIEAEFAARYPYRALHPQDGFSGQGVLSRYPITNDEYWPMTLGHQQVWLDFAGTPITLYNVHPIQPLAKDGFAIRGREITDMFNRLADETVPVILAGDFNLSDLSEDYARVAGRYTDVYRAVGWGMGYTFPAVRHQLYFLSFFTPLVRLDYVFHDDHFQAVEAHVWPDAGGSDHRPLFARLALVSVG